MMKHYRIEYNSEYMGPSFSCVEQAVEWAQNNGYITYNEVEEKFESDIEIVEFEL